MSSFLTQLMDAVLPTVAMFCLLAVLVVAITMYRMLLQRLPANMRAEIQTLASTVVQAIEQQYAGRNAGGAAKKQAALDLLATLVRDVGWHMNTAYASVAIEAAVYGLKSMTPRAEHVYSTTVNLPARPQSNNRN